MKEKIIATRCISSITKFHSSSLVKILLHCDFENFETITLKRVFFFASFTPIAETEDEAYRAKTKEKKTL